MDRPSEPSKPPSGSTLIALPFVSKSGFTGATTMSLVLGILAGGLKNCKFLFLGDHSQIGARNAAAADAIKEGLDYLFFVDSDMDFPTDTLDRLKACDADIACTDMWSRNIPSFRTVMRMSGRDKHGLKMAVPYAGKGVEAVDLCGMACTLIRTDLLKRMREKLDGDIWFQSASHGEDASFCFMAREMCDATIKCDFDVVAGHWGVLRLVGQDFTRDAKHQPMQVANPEMLLRMGAKL